MRAVLRLGSWLTVVGTVPFYAPQIAPADPTVHPLGEALVVGCGLGAGAFLVLARRRIRAEALAHVPRRRLIARSIALAARSAQEEAVWRALVLGILVGPLGRLGALASSTVLFTCAHAGRQRGAARAHLVTGSAFGVAYLVTARLVAAVAAHAVYNVLAGAGSLTREHMSRSDTSAVNATLVASPEPSEPLGSMLPAHPSAAPQAPIARLEGVVKSFGPVRALDGIDLDLRPGEILALLGPNGAGKSTAVAVLLGLRRADAGRAVLFGRDPRDPVARRRIGVVLQEVAFPPSLRVRDALTLVAAHFPDARDPSRALERLGLAGLAGRDAGGLSVGQRRRLAVGLALAGEPTALFLDEPTAGMDANARRAVLGDIAGFAAGGGAVLLTTQELGEAEEIASRVVLVAHGRVVVGGTVGEIRAHAGRARIRVTASDLPPACRAATVERRGDRHVAYVDDADAFVAELVRSGIPFSELQVVPVTLEDAFVALTSETAE